MTQESLFLLFDLVGIFAFAISGAFKAIRKSLDLLGILVLGFATAMGGGAIRAPLVLEIPMMLHADLYATAALLGGLSFVFLSAAVFQPSVVSAVAFLTTLLLRIAVIYLGWSLPKLR